MTRSWSEMEGGVRTCASAPERPWEMHYKRSHPVQTNPLSASWTSSYLMRTDIMAHRCCCADELVGLLAASKFNRCRHRCGLQRGRMKTLVYTRSTPSIQMEDCPQFTANILVPSTHPSVSLPLLKSDQTAKCCKMWIYVLLTKLRQCWRNPKAPTKNRCPVCSSKTWQRQHFDTQPAGYRVHLFVSKRGRG